MRTHSGVWTAGFACRGTVLVVLLATAPACVAEQARQTGTSGVDILFIGNSYTYYNDLPGMLRSMAAADSDALDVHVASVVEDGASLRSHWNGRTMDLIRRGGWEYVVLQEQSLAPIDARDQFMEYGKRFTGEIQAANAKPVLFLTWSHQQRPTDQEQLNQAYATLAQQTGAVLVPVGRVWQALRDGGSGVPTLYADDGSHPSPVGSLVAASTFYRVLFGESLTTRTGTAHGLSAKATRGIQEAIEAAMPAVQPGGR
jgi:hypothetical protein